MRNSENIFKDMPDRGKIRGFNVALASFFILCQVF